jgi:hypothetical protein
MRVLTALPTRTDRTTGDVVTAPGTKSLTIVPCSVTQGLQILALKGRRLVMRPAGASAVPAGGASSAPLPGGFGTTPGRHYDRPATVIAGRGQAEADNARLLAKSQEVRLELSGGVSSLPQVPRWNAGRRARPTAEGRRKPPFRGASRTRWCGHALCVCRRSASLLFFFVLSFS